ncbi:hypothetical protein UFOVP29_405 [uncultured Caudovirales phage]|uniref:Uncharacterized protein n=1 Tax=uncultured Caudovirales phage TaxID=2100421 RepID=A0A6J5KPR7_9CAUD|nr:hypothetical protein UFOVP29_405 [uncultured Caudovirales phage]
MPGMFRDEEYYTHKFGIDEGRKKYEITLNRRMARQRRANANRPIKITDTETSISVGDSIRCLECGCIRSRLQWTHFANKCSGQIHSIAEYLQKYPGAPLVAPTLIQRTKNTLQNMIEIYGEVTGPCKWKAYCDKQAETNSLEYKAKKYGWTPEDFDEYNKSRSVTLNHCIERHGEELGLEIWSSYCDRQRETCTLEYFKSKWGEDAGSNRYYNWMKSWVSNGKSEDTVFQEIQKLLPNTQLARQIRLEKSNGTQDGRFGYFYDFGSTSDKKLIEFNGSVWHANPKIYSESFVLPGGKDAKTVWEHDRNKISNAITQGFKVYIIWDDDWINNRNDVLSNLLRWWNEN